MSHKIFISYRRLDAIKDARSLYERLSREFGPDEVFIDLDGIAPGEDFVELLERQLDDCSALVVLMGRDWATERLFDENDFVRIEVGAGLRRKIKVFPVLINGAVPPKSTELPEELRPLLRRQAISLDDRKFDADVAALAQAIRRAIEPAPAPPADTPPAAAPAPRSASSPAPQGPSHPVHKPSLRELHGAALPAGERPPGIATHATPPARDATTSTEAASKLWVWAAIAIAVVGAIVGAVLLFSDRSGGSGAYGSVTPTPVDEARPSVDHPQPVPQASGGDDKAADATADPAETAKPGKADARHADSSATSQVPGTQANEKPSPLVGQWINSVPGDGAALVISQNGTTITIVSQNGFTSEYTLGKGGRAIKRTMFAQDSTQGHEVANERDADLVVTTIASVKDDVLFLDTTSDYRRPYFKQAAHIQTSQRQFRRR
jgi:hypothetical protein